MSRAFEDITLLIPWLQAHPGSTVPEVAEHFGLPKDRVAQYIQLAACTGPGFLHGELLDLRIEHESIFVDDSLGFDRPFRFDQVEAACLLLGLDLLARYPAAAVDLEPATIESARTKITDCLPKPPTVGLVPVAEHEEAESVRTVSQAVAEDRQIRFDYWNEARDDVGTRRVSPLELAVEDGVQVVRGFDHGKSAWRTFQLGRMQNLESLSEPRDITGDFAPMPTTWVSVRVPNAYRHVLERASRQRKVVTAKEHTTAEIGVLEPAWLARLVLTSGRKLEVLAPAEFADAVAVEVAAAEAAYSK